MTPEIVAKIERGDMLSDQELRVALVFYEDMAKKLMILGPKFHFAFVECNHRAVELDGYRRNRDMK